MSDPANATNTRPEAISADEIALYDRQIRLWGMKAQQKIRNANVLLVTVKALGNEIAKNLALAGVGSLTLHDNAHVTEDDLCSQFFLQQSDIGRFRATAAATPIQKLNPRVMIHVETRDIFSLPTSYFEGFDIIIGTDLRIQGLNTLNANARMCKKAFYAAASHGMYGYVFADLIEHTYVITRTKGNVATKPGPETATRTVVTSTIEQQNGKDVELVQKRESYQPLILANTSPLPASYINSARRLRNVTPLLPCLRALWEFEKTVVPYRTLSATSTSDFATFKSLASQMGRELQLPASSLPDAFLSSFLTNLHAELSPVCAFLGAQLAQDVINVLGNREQPIQNMLLFDAEESLAPVYALYPVYAVLDGGMRQAKAMSPTVLNSPPSLRI